VSALGSATSDQGASLRQTALTSILVGVIFYFGCELGLALVTPSDNIATFFPANAVVLAALLLTSQRRWWVYLFVMVLADIAVSIGDGLLIHRVILFAAANLLEVLVAAIGLRLFVASPLKFERLHETLMYLLLAVLVGPLASAFVASIVTLLEAPESSYWLFWRAWFLSNALGLLIVTPLIVLWFRSGFSWLNLFR